MNHPTEITNSLTNEERETHFNLCATDRHVWDVYTDDPVMYAKLLRKGHAPTWCDGTAARFVVDDRWLTFRTVLSEAEQERRSAQAREALRQDA